MFKFFKKNKQVKYIVVMSDNILYQGWYVAVFYSEDAAREYCDFKNNHTEDPYLEWSYYIRK